MLESLHISNYALIDAMDIDFHSGLNIITGETGAGKSIILGAITMLLGGRADSKAIRRTDSKSVIECTFDVTGNEQLHRYCMESDIEWDDNQCILRREISPSGRSRAFINDSPVTLAQMQSIGLRLIDIHSQHQNQLLASPDFQRTIIDSLAENTGRLKEYDVLYSRFREALRRLKLTKAAIARDKENSEFMAYQLNQLEELNPQPDELAQLEHDRELIAGSADIKRHLHDALEALSEGNVNTLSLLQSVQTSCDELEQVLPGNDNIPGRISDILVEINDINETLSRMYSETGADPDDLDDIDNRISELHSFMRRHHVESPQQLIEIRDNLRSRLQRIDDAPAMIADLEKEARRAHRIAIEAAKTISETRRHAALEFARNLKEAATPLGMKNLHCEIDVTTTDLGPTGIDNVEFRFAFNKNQTPIPVNGAASGGEISRLMLCIKAIIADRIQLPSIVFDEVDTGVSGEVASRMGQLMQDMSASLQVIAITHLPQVAAKGAHHYKVFKADDEHATHTRIARLTREERIDELALMLSGDPVSDAARANARELLASSI